MLYKWKPSPIGDDDDPAQYGDRRLDASECWPNELDLAIQFASDRPDRDSWGVRAMADVLQAHSERGFCGEAREDLSAVRLDRLRSTLTGRDLEEFQAGERRAFYVLSVLLTGELPAGEVPDSEHGW